MFLISKKIYIILSTLVTNFNEEAVNNDIEENKLKTFNLFYFPSVLLSPKPGIRRGTTEPILNGMGKPFYFV